MNNIDPRMTMTFALLRVPIFAAMLAGAGLPSLSANIQPAPPSPESTTMDSTRPDRPHSLPILPRRPNIILITVDGLGYGDLGCYGQRNIKTPNLDELATGGIKFITFYVGSPVASMSRQTLLMGRHSGHINDLTASSAPNLAQLLKIYGYHTTCVGLWGLTSTPQRNGFDEWLGFLTEAEASEAYPSRIWRFDPASRIGENGQLQDFEGVVELDGRSRSATEIFTTAAVNFIKIKKPDRFNKFRPFFLYLSYPSPRIVATNDLAPFENEPWPVAEKAKAASIARLDADVGKIMQTLKDLKQESNTFIIFTSVCGPKKTGGSDPIFHRSPGGLHWTEDDELLEGNLRVPCIVSCPSKVGANSQSDQLWAAWDIFPTLADIGMAQLPRGLDGHSLLSRLNDSAQTNCHEYLYWEDRSGGNIRQAVRTDDWKAIITQPAGQKELFNLKTDTAEKNDLAKHQPEELEKLETIANQFQAAPKAP